MVEIKPGHVRRLSNAFGAKLQATDFGWALCGRRVFRYRIVQIQRGTAVFCKVFHDALLVIYKIFFHMWFVHTITREYPLLRRSELNIPLKTPQRKIPAK